ncbi:L,D-transpeptidase family protein [uncultured Methylobacterium sp.]|uniref:L,D-transpeptidase family protein n=1 Tax=uncultured Methylobacterium sp. TaxID=157278 RepID=UPI00263737E9|nr:L,D-transpeptidase family protein [uncultured Methylobacterium sp.]
MAKRPVLAACVLALGLSLGACQDGGFAGGGSTKHLTPIPPATLALMSTKGMSASDPILIRAYKKEAEMEVWKRGTSGQYALLKTFPICRWSGQLGPKIKEGDRQAPEGFYTITPGQMNPNSSYYLSFDTGFPNAFDRANNRTGRYLMVHGTCSSSGCFAMTDEAISEIYAIARDAFNGGQRGFQFQSYPFRMTAQNVAKFRHDPHMPFWKNLKEGSDYFEALHEEPRVGVCGTRYVFGGQDAAAGSCSPRVDTLVAEKRVKDEQEVADLVAKGTPAVRVVYQDGGQNPFFRDPAPASGETQVAEAPVRRPALGMVSRPEALAAGPQELTVDGKGKPLLMADTREAVPAAQKGKPTPLAFAAPATLAPPIPTREAARVLAATKPSTAPEPVTTASATPVTVASADDDPSAYRKILGNLFASKPAEAPAPAVVAAAPAAEPTAPAPLAVTRKVAPKPHPVPQAGAAAKADPAKSDASKTDAGKPSAAAKPGYEGRDAVKPGEAGKRAAASPRHQVAGAQTARPDAAN